MNFLLLISFTTFFNFNPLAAHLEKTVLETRDRCLSKYRSVFALHFSHNPFFLTVYIKIMKQFKDAERKEKMLFFAWKEKIFNNDDVDERARK